MRCLIGSRVAELFFGSPAPLAQAAPNHRYGPGSSTNAVEISWQRQIDEAPIAGLEPTPRAIYGDLVRSYTKDPAGARIGAPRCASFPSSSVTSDSCPISFRPE